MKIAVTTPYRENSVMAIARAAAAAQKLACFYTTIYLAKVASLAHAIPVPPLRRRMEAQLLRRTFPGVPKGRVKCLASVPELTHIFFRRLFPYRKSLSAHFMYKAKDSFDNALARHMESELRCREPDSVVGMFSAVFRTFKVIKKRGGLAIYNFVNSHPTYHNRYLRELAGITGDHHELIPSWVASKVEKELEIADLILVPSQFVAKQLLEIGLSQDKVAVEPYGVDLAAFHPANKLDTKWCLERSSRNKNLRCLYVGQISHRKGITVLMETARRCMHLPVQFTLIGPIVSRELLDRIRRNVSYQGAVFHGGVPEAMRKADVLILPSLEDACALVVIEAMASGLPVITTTQNGSGEIISHVKDGIIVPPGDVSTLVEAVEQLVEDPAWRKEMGERAREKVESSYSWRDYGNKVIAKLQELRLK